MNTLDVAGNYERPTYVKEPTESSRLNIREQQPTGQKRDIEGRYNCEPLGYLQRNEIGERSSGINP